MATKRNGRQDAIRWIVRNKPIRTQRELVAELRERGFNCTQATASRDIADMRLRKLPEGIYVLAEDLHLQRMVCEFVEDAECVAHLTVVRTQAGTAPGVAAAIDSADLTDVMGSIAGNDTVLVICRTHESSDEVADLINKLRRVATTI